LFAIGLKVGFPRKELKLIVAVYLLETPQKKCRNVSSAVTRVTTIGISTYCRSTRTIAAGILAFAISLIRSSSMLENGQKIVIQQAPEPPKAVYISPTLKNEKLHSALIT
jgi:hypothetical protein